MGYFIPDPRWEMPELLIPGRKPVGEVEINTLHPAAPDKQCYLLGGQGETARDLVTGAWAIREGTNAINTTVSAGNLNLDFVNTGGDSTSAAARLQLPPTGALPTGYLLVEFTPGSTSGVQYIFAHADYVPNKRLYLYHSSGSLQVTLGSSGNSVATITTGTKYVCCVTWNNGDVKVYLNGVEEVDSTYSNEPGSDKADVTQLAQLSTGGSPLPYDSAYDGEIAFVALGSQPLPDAMARGLTLDSYQFLIPK